VHRHRGGRHFSVPLERVNAPADRRDMRARLHMARLRLGAAERVAAASALVSTLEQLPQFLVAARVAGYWAVGGELPLNLALGRLRSREQTYHLPVLAPGTTLRFAPWETGAAVQPNRLGIPEPECDPAMLLPARDMELVLLPLLGFARSGNRLGAGAGYYDRSFAFLQGQPRPTRPLLVGIGYHFQELPELAHESWDVPMDFVATDRELIACRPV
jgi:5-formyltetrahydrofolate cyclo-ligase